MGENLVIKHELASQPVLYFLCIIFSAMSVPRSPTFKTTGVLQSCLARVEHQDFVTNATPDPYHSRASSLLSSQVIELHHLGTPPFRVPTPNMHVKLVLLPVAFNAGSTPAFPTVAASVGEPCTSDSDGGEVSSIRLLLYRILRRFGCRLLPGIRVLSKSTMNGPRYIAEHFKFSCSASSR